MNPEQTEKWYVDGKLTDVPIVQWTEQTDPLSNEAKEAWCRMIWATSKNENKEDLIQATEIGWQECARRALIETDGLEARIKNDAEEIKRLRELLKAFVTGATYRGIMDGLCEQAEKAMEGKE